MKRPGILVTIAVTVALTALLAWGVSTFGGDSREPRRTSLLLSEDATSSADADSATGAENTATAPVREQVAEAEGEAAENGSTSGSSAGSNSSGSTPGGSSDPSQPVDDEEPPVYETPPLTLEQRKACYYDLIAAQDRAVAEAEAAFPLDSEDADVEAHMELRFELLARYEAEVREEYGVTSEQLDAIVSEGIQNNWPMPPLEE